MHRRVREVPATWKDKLRRFAYSTFYVTSMLSISIPYILLDMLLTPIFPRFTVWFLWSLFQVIQALVGARVELKNAHNLTNNPKAVIVMNHQTIYDFYMISSTYHLYGDVHTVSRKEVFYFWPIGYAMWRSGSLFIDLSSPQGALNHLISEARKLFSPTNPKASKIIMFPEGTRNKDVNSFMDFKKGAFKVAMACNVPVIPIVQPPQTFLRKFPKTKVVLECLHPVMLNAKEDLDAQIDKIKNDMFEVYSKQIDNLVEKGELLRDEE